MTPEDLGAYRVPSDPRLHPDGERVAFVVTQMNLDEDRYDRQIWLSDGGGARPFTAGPGDSTPRWSPDGSQLAFLRAGTEKGAVAQVHVMPVDGGEARSISDFPLGATELEWSPDGDNLAAVGTSWRGEWADVADDEDERSRMPRRVDEVPWRSDNRGWTHDRRSHVYLLRTDGDSEPQLLTDGDYDEGGIAWHPDGTRIAFLSARHDERGLDAGNQVWEVPVAGGEAAPMVDVGMWGYVGYRPDGAPHVMGQVDRWDYPSVPTLFRREADGTLTDLTGSLDRNTLPFTPAISPAGPQWVGESAFLATLEDDGRVRVIRVEDDGAVTDVLGGDRVITGVSPRPDASAFAFAATTATDPGELYWWADGAERPLTTLNESFRAEAGLIEPQPFSFENDGVELHGWAYLPPGDEPVPLLLNIHGGPATQYGLGFFDEFQVLAAAGYGVVACNPRGSSGRGRDFVRAPVGQWDEEAPLDMRDLLGCVDAALVALPRLDSGRIGVMGGSYGGYATLRLLAIDDRFASAVVERSLASTLSFAGTSDIGTWFNRMYLDGTLPDDWQRFYLASPMAYAHRITTPTLVVHSEVDYRTPIEQGEQVFVMLKRHGVTTEMVRFPGESHELTRSGKPKHRSERFAIILDWHARHLLAADAG